MGGNRDRMAGGGKSDNRKMALGNRQARAPVDKFRRSLGLRETRSTSARQEKAELVKGSDNALSRRDIRDFFTSTPFLLFVLLLLVGIVTYVFWSFAHTPIVKMNAPPVDFTGPQAHRPPVGGG